MTKCPTRCAALFRLKMVAIYMGFVASLHFAVILIPVSRDSKLWSAVGIPFERAVLYHVIAGHLAFTAVFTHCILFVAYWVWTEGWKHAWETSTTQVSIGGRLMITCSVARNWRPQKGFRGKGWAVGMVILVVGLILSSLFCLGS